MEDFVKHFKNLSSNNNNNNIGENNIDDFINLNERNVQFLELLKKVKFEKQLNL